MNTDTQCSVFIDHRMDKTRLKEKKNKKEKIKNKKKKEEQWVNKAF